MALTEGGRDVVKTTISRESGNGEEPKKGLAAELGKLWQQFRLSIALLTGAKSAEPQVDIIGSDRDHSYGASAPLEPEDGAPAIAEVYPEAIATTRGAPINNVVEDDLFFRNLRALKETFPDSDPGVIFMSAAYSVGGPDDGHSPIQIRDVRRNGCEDEEEEYGQAEGEGAYAESEGEGPVDCVYNDPADNNCNGMTDENDYDNAGSEGEGEGYPVAETAPDCDSCMRCCVGTSEGACLPRQTADVTPVMELMDDLDDDCDGFVDEYSRNS